MANKKISALTSVTVPLTGTEVIPVVQGGVTLKTSVSDITAGRVVETLGINTVVEANAPATLMLRAYASALPISYAFNIFQDGSGTSYSLHIAEGTTKYVSVTNSASGVAGDVKLWIGNLVQGTAAKGINFTANTHAAGMTSQLLNWYEEGTWTPNQGAGLTVVGAFSSSGTYTRVGRQITVRGQVVGATSVAVVAAGVMSSNLPFAASVSHAGSMFNSAVTTSGVVQITASSVVAATTIAATPNITFTATYTV